MARITPYTRSVAVSDAISALPDAIATAVTFLADHGADDARTREAWETVEKLGATVHRQSRLLAGKPRGG